MAHDLDLVSWLEEIRDAILYEPTNLWVGFSFLCHNSKNDSVIYIFAAMQLATYHTKFSSRSKLNDFIDDFKGKNHHDLLEETFVAQQDDNPFSSSGFRPYKLVCNYVWIRK